MNKQEMIKNLTGPTGMLEELHESELRPIYDVIWNLTASNLLLKCSKKKVEELEEKMSVRT